ncbi:MAG: glycoside hydrolase family 2 TIM barrel-domain containing protein [Verrucomicrobiota bacterium]
MPTSVVGVREPVLSLNGTWDFCPDATDKDPQWRPIEVPGEWVMQGFEVAPEKAAAYERTFSLPTDWTGMNVRLRFDAVYSVARVLVNGAEVGRYEGPFEVFEFDVTSAVRPGENLLRVEVTSQSQADAMAFASTYASHDLGGISRKVTLFATPVVFLSDLTPRTRRADDGAWELEVHAYTCFMEGQPALECRFELAAVRSQGLIPLTLLESEKDEAPGGQLACDRFRVEGVKAWDCEHPHLYLLTCTLEAAGEKLAVYEQRVGFREVAVVGPELHVNGRPVKLRGVNRHEVHPRRGRANCADLTRRDVDIFRDGNVNFIRTSHYPPPEELLDAADELGMFVECEAALCWVGDVNRPPWDRRDAAAPGFLAGHQRANAANVIAHRRHPSVLFWSLGNECAWSPSFSQAQDLVKTLDPTRPTIFHNINEHGEADIMNHHYPVHFHGTPPGQLLAERNQPLLIGEDYHVQVYNRREVATDPGVREDWGRCLQAGFEEFYRVPQVLGVAIWAGIDDVFCLPDGRAVGYGPWGVIDGWRREKPEFWHMKKGYSPVRLGATEVPWPENGKLCLPVENRFDFTDLAELVIRWEGGGEQGEIHAQLAPRESGELELPLPVGLAPGDGVTLRFVDAGGRCVERERIQVGEAAEAKAAYSRVTFPDLKAAAPAPPGAVIRRGGLELTLPGEGVRFSLRRDGSEVLCSLPGVMLLPLETRKGTTNDFGEEVEPLTDACFPPPNAALRMAGDEDHLDLAFGVEDEAAKATITLRLEDSGRLAVHARVKILAEVTPRQYGLVFALPADFTVLSWKRESLWSLFPEDHIGRTEGVALATGARFSWAEPATHPWSQDASPLGSNDFRATRTKVHRAELRAGDGPAIVVHGGGRLAVRAWRRDGQTFLLVADFNTGGNDSFAREFYAAERVTFQPGDTLELGANLEIS